MKSLTNYIVKKILLNLIGMALEWDKGENKKISKFGKTLDIDINNKYNWEKAIRWQYNMASKLRNVLLPKVKDLN